MSKECLWPPQGSGTQHKSLRCSRLCILLSCLPFLEERGKPESAPSLSVSQTAVSVATEADTWAASALPCRTTVEGLQSPCLLGEVAGESWEEEGSFKQKGIHGAQLQGGSAHQNVHLQEAVSNQMAKRIQCHLQSNNGDGV